MTGTFFVSDKVMTLMVGKIQRQKDKVVYQENNKAQEKVAMVARDNDLETAIL